LFERHVECTEEGAIHEAEDHKSCRQCFKCDTF
jgi:hypothetical protein